MASEPLYFRMMKEGDFDGLTLIDKRRQDFIAQAGRVYSINLSGAAGQIAGDFFGFFTDNTPKSVSIAGPSWNPQSVARVISKDDPDVFREEIDLTPQMVHVPMYPGDRLGIVTRDGSRTCVQIVVTDLSESEHVALALQSKPSVFSRRLRIVRSDGSGFSHLPLTSTFDPDFTWDVTTNMLITSAISAGVIPARSLCHYPRFQGCYISVRYSGIGAGDAALYIVDGHLREAWEAQATLKNGEWSKPQFVSHDDYIGLSSPAPAGGTVVCDLELVRVEPGDRLRGRYERGL
ncbi:MAG: hypothetical protein R3B09_26755 [Nannocystaceae bacterium]